MNLQIPATATPEQIAAFQSLAIALTATLEDHGYTWEVDDVRPAGATYAVLKNDVRVLTLTLDADSAGTNETGQ